MRERKSYSKSFKAQVAHECQQPGVSVAAIAMSRGINTNVIHRRLSPFRDQQAVVLPAFAPVNFAPVNPKPKAQAPAVIELPFGEQTITGKRPASDPEGCAQFVRRFALCVATQLEPPWVARICKDAFITRIEKRKMPWTQ